MAKNRVFYLILLLTVWVTYVFGNEFGTLSIAILVTLFPLFLLLTLRLRLKRVSLELSVDEIVAEGKRRTVYFSYQIRYRGKFPGGCVWIVTHMVNNYISETMTDSIKAAVRPLAGREKTVTVSRSFDTEACGEITITPETFCLMDSFGLWKLKIPYERASVKQSFVIMPNLFPMEVSIEEDVTAMIDSERYSANLAGNDPGETFAIREYIAGDSLRTIHWKLSQKTDKLLVREFGLPVVNQILILFENVILDEKKIPPEKKVVLVDVLNSLGNALLEEQKIFTLCFLNHGIEEISEFEIQDKEQFHEAVSHLLGQPFTHGGETVASRYMQGREVCAYAHVAVLAAETFPDYDLLYNGNHVTLIVEESGHRTKGYVGDGLYKINYTTENVREDLGQISL